MKTSQTLIPVLPPKPTPEAILRLMLGPRIVIAFAHGDQQHVLNLLYIFRELLNADPDLTARVDADLRMLEARQAALP